MTAGRERDSYDRIMARDRRGIYESHYLKGNSPDGREAFWIKHNLLVPPDGEGGLAEFWLVHFHRERAPRVRKREVPIRELALDGRDLVLRGDHFQLDRRACAGKIADASWRLAFSGGLPPLFHFAPPRFYTGRFPKKKILTPVANMVFDGELTIGGAAIEVRGWTGLRGHNWGAEHAYTYVYGSCNQWDDGARDRAIDGFTARIKIGPVLSPWLSSLVCWDGAHKTERNRVRDWIPRRALVEPRRWELGYGDVELTMEGERGQYAGLRYRSPGGREAYCYNTKLARVRVVVGGKAASSAAGEHEVLYPDPLPEIPLHPTATWSQSDGDYRSSDP